MTAWLARDSMMRVAALTRVLALQREYRNAIPWSAIAQGFSLDGQTFPLASKAEGIYKPAGHPAALSIRTPIPRGGRENPYNDALSSTEGVFRYHYKDHGGPDNPSNAALRVALQNRLPLVYFWGLTPSVYAAIVPVFVVADFAASSEFGVAPGDALERQEAPSHIHAVMTSVPEKEYVSRIVRERLHQRAFRELVVSAYSHRCAMCSIHYDELLEAAHILPDRDVRGRPEVANGLALCSLHHDAFDRFLVDVTDDYRLQLGPSLRARRNGPVFQAAFIDRDQMPINLPAAPSMYPGRSYLEARRALSPLL